jgi:hypothetical protein
MDSAHPKSVALASRVETAPSHVVAVNQVRVLTCRTVLRMALWSTLGIVEEESPHAPTVGRWWSPNIGQTADTSSVEG